MKNLTSDAEKNRQKLLTARSRKQAQRQARLTTLNKKSARLGMPVWQLVRENTQEMAVASGNVWGNLSTFTRGCPDCSRW